MAAGMIRAIETGRAALPTLRLFPRFRLIRMIEGRGRRLDDLTGSGDFSRHKEE